MAIATLAALKTPDPRIDAAAPAPRAPSRVYSPFATKRLTHPMAVRADAGMIAGANPRWSLFRRGAKERSG